VAIVGNSDALALIAADTAVAAGLEVQMRGELGPDASADEFEKALDGAIDDAEVDAVLALYIPPVNTTGVDVANVLAVVGEQSDKPVVSTFLAAQGIPELLRVPDLAGSTAGRGSVPSYGSPDSAVRALARAAEYAAWLARPEPEIVAPAEADQVRARATVNRALMTSPEGRDLDDAELTELLGAYGIDLWQRIPVDSAESAVRAGEGLGWDVVLKATADHLRHRPDLAHVWRNIDNEEEMRDAWETMHGLIESRANADFVVQRIAPAGVPVAIHGAEDPLFGPVVSFGVSGAFSELLGDCAFRIPPMNAHDAHEMVREIKASPLLLGYRGSEPVDTAALESLLLKVAQLKNDLPQVRAIELALVIVGLRGATVLTAKARIEPAVDARADWYARRMTTQAGETFAE
jgi:acyl-CoA synthetase (NDP forming)